MRARGKEGGGREELAVNPRNPRAGAIGDGAERLDHDDAEDGDDDDVSGGADSPPFRPPPPAAGGRRRGLVGVRAAFPASFGRQEQRVTPLEAVHARTARGPAESVTGVRGSGGKRGRWGPKGKKKAGGMTFSIGPSLAKRLGDGAKAELAGAARQEWRKEGMWRGRRRRRRGGRREGRSRGGGWWVEGRRGCCEGVNGSRG
ncbi:hypothetical protein CLOM_g15251 [Closterium sp. NIES-68]|nr:hypothetical protein CLOM_g15251 [Closterium sp. NIES-68]